VTQTTVANAIRARFASQVATPQSLTTVYDNDPTTEYPTTWCRFTVEFGDCTRLTTGGPGSVTYRTAGRVIAQVFGPVGKGDAGVIALVDAIIAAFRGVSIASPAIMFSAPSSSASANDPAGPWFMRVVSIPFAADETA